MFMHSSKDKLKALSVGTEAKRARAQPGLEVNKKGDRILIIIKAESIRL